MAQTVSHLSPAQRPLPAPLSNAMAISTSVNSTILSITQTAINVFLSSKQDNGSIAGLGYWQVANGYTAIALHDSWSGTDSNADILDSSFGLVEVNHTDLINDFNDDSMWWGMASLEMYNLTEDLKYLSTAEAIQTHVSAYVQQLGEHVINGTDYAGAVLWTNHTDEHGVNSITTGLYSELCARLANLVTTMAAQQDLLGSAIQSFQWIQNVLYRPDDFVVQDGVDLTTGALTDWTFTYTTGQIIAAAIAISKALGSGITPLNNITNPGTAESYLDLAAEIATHAMVNPAWVDKNGTLVERDTSKPLPPNTNNDGVGFKSILLRNLVKLFRTLNASNTHTDVQTQIKAFIEKQFATLQEFDTNGQGQYGPWWDGPWDSPSTWSQMAALDVMAGIWGVNC
jgi:predicted alpha-1,6-mannanase (GH76 family)